MSTGGNIGNIGVAILHHRQQDRQAIDYLYSGCHVYMCYGVLVLFSDGMYNYAVRAMVPTRSTSAEGNFAYFLFETLAE